MQLKFLAACILFGKVCFRKTKVKVKLKKYVWRELQNPVAAIVIPLPDVMVLKNFFGCFPCTRTRVVALACDQQVTRRARARNFLLGALFSRDGAMRGVIFPDGAIHGHVPF